MKLGTNVFPLDAALHLHFLSSHQSTVPNVTDTSTA